jgi:hypothetical protein
MCDCYYAFRINYGPRSSIYKTRLIDKNELKFMENYLFEYPYAPLSIYKFNYCPKCGLKLK